jgi:hypothetical protein
MYAFKRQEQSYIMKNVFGTIKKMIQRFVTMEIIAFYWWSAIE